VLTVNEVTSRSRAKDYYSAGDYYQETIGNWGGQLAAEWGLTGQVTQDPFNALVDGRHPVTGRRLTAGRRDDSRVGYDFTVSLVKSASIVRAFAGEDLGRQMDAARDDAVACMMAEVEADMHCRERRDGADYDVTTGNLIYAAFNHTTARPVDPKKFLARFAGKDDWPDWLQEAGGKIPPDMDDHVHILVMNVTKSPDGRLLAGQFGNLKKDAEYYSALFDARYAANLQKLGFSLEKSGGKRWEIAGITPEMIEKFSKRKQEIDAEARRRGITDAREKGELGAKTRSNKDKTLTREELLAAWREQLSDEDRDALAAVYRGRGHNGGPRVSALEAVAFAVEHCFYREAVISEKQLVATALLYGLGDVTAGQVRAEFEGHGVILSERDGRLMATTKEAYAMERFYVNHAMYGRGCVVTPVGVPEGLERGILDDEQWHAVESLMTSCDKVQLVDSAAGVGKSTMLSVYARGMAMAGRHATYLATTTPAVDVLRQDGFEAETLAKFLLSEKMQDAATGGTVVLDEASFLGLKDAYRLFQIAKDKDISLVLLGDSRQHASVSAGGGAVMRTLREYAHIEPIRITKVKRQLNEDHRQAVELLFAGQVLDAFDILDQKLGWVHEIKDDDARYAALAAAYLDGLKSGIAWDQILVSSPTHAEGQRAVDAIRSLLRQEKLIGKDDREFTRWVSADLSDAEKADARSYRPGRVDMVQFFRRAKGHEPGTRLLVDENGVSSLPFDQPKAFQAYRKESVKFAVGDIIRFTANGRTLDGKHQIRNASRYKIAGFTDKGIRLDNGWLVARDFGHWRHGIETSHSSQSKSPQLALSAVSSRSLGVASSEMEYVDASRARLKQLTFTDDKDALRRAIQRSSLKLAAHDLVHGRTPEQAARWKRQAEASRRAMLERNRADAEALAARRRATTPQPEPPRPPSPHLDRLTQQERGFGYGR
jgi:hypothetical protein